MPAPRSLPQNIPAPHPPPDHLPPLPPASAPAHTAPMQHHPAQGLEHKPELASAAPSALAAVSAAHSLSASAAPSGPHPPASSSAPRPGGVAMPNLLSSIPLTFSSIPLPSINPLSQPILPSSSIPPLAPPLSAPADLHQFATLAPPVANPPLQHSDLSLGPAIHPAHPHQHQQHDPASDALSSFAVTINAAAEAARAAAATGDLESQHDPRADPPPSHPNAYPPPGPAPAAPPIHPNQAANANPVVHHNPAHSAHRDPDSSTSSDAAGAASTDGIGAASTVGAASTDGAGGASGSSSGLAPDERRARRAGRVLHSPDAAANAPEPPSSGRRRTASEMAPNEAINSNKRPHRSISHAEKRRLCEISDANPTAKHGHIASVFQSETGRRIERSTVTRVLQRKEFWMNAGTRDSNRKRLTSPRFPTIEEALFEFIRNRARLPSLRAKLTDKELMKHSKDIAETMRKEHGSMDKNSSNYAPHLRAFRGSLSWVTSFKKRNALMPPEDSRPFPVRPFVSHSFPGETLDIWKTEMKVSEATETLSNWTRLEDLYFLDALALAPSARPESVVPSHGSTLAAQEATAGLDEALGIMGASHSETNPPPHDTSGAGMAAINFSLPPISAAIDGLPNGNMSSNNQQDQSGFAVHTSDPFGGSSQSAEQAQANPAPAETRHPVDESSVVQILCCTNGVGNDRRTPWIVGRKPLQSIGSKDGEVWRDCSVRYFHNKQGWITGRLVRKWIEEFDQSVDRGVAVATSLLNACDLELLDLKYVTVVPLPRTELDRERASAMQWTSSSASPMHHGVEQLFRAKYRSLVLEKALHCMGKDLPIRPLTVKSTAKLVKEAWDKVPVPVIRRAWRELPYLPPRLQRNSTRPRSNGKPMWGQTLNELERLLVTYRDAISSYALSSQAGLRPADVIAAVAEPSDYMWLSVEQGPFHPTASILDFVRSVCSEEAVKDPGSDDEEVIPTPRKGAYRIEDHADALDAVNKLADFMKSDELLRTGHSLYLIGSLQLEIKKVYDQRQNDAQQRSWIAAQGQRVD